MKPDHSIPPKTVAEPTLGLNKPGTDGSGRRGSGGARSLAGTKSLSPLQSGGLSGGMGFGMSDSSGIQIYTTTALLTEDAPWGEIQKVTYQLQASANPSAGGKDLIRSVTRNLLPTMTEESEDQYLASGVE